MRHLIRKLLRESSEEKALNPKEIALFKYLNFQKQKNLKPEAFYDELKKGASMFGLNPKDAVMYLELFRLNYREDGRYENVTKDNFNDATKMKEKRTTNVDASQFARFKRPFYGSNLLGKWETDRKGDDQYVILSYGWYPIYIWKKGIWYSNLNNYSSSTSKHISYSNPLRYDRSINELVVALNSQDMSNIRDGVTLDEVLSRIKSSILNKESNLINKDYSFMFYRDYPSRIKVIYNVTQINQKGDSLEVKINVKDVYELVDNRRVKSPESRNYLRNEIPNVDKKTIEQNVSSDFINRISDMGGTKNISFNFKFKHLLEN